MEAKDEEKKLDKQEKTRLIVKTKRGDEIIKNKEGKWVQGQSGNPSGRPKGISITEMVKQALEEVDEESGLKWKALVIKRILSKAVDEGDQVMLKAIWNYIDGLPPQSMDLTTKGEQINNIYGLIQQAIFSSSEKDAK